MKTVAVLSCIVLAAGIAGAQGNYNIIKRQARDAVGQTQSASQGQPTPARPPSSAPAPASPNPAPVDPVLAATLQNIADLRHDFDALSAGFGPKSLTNDLATAATGTKASTESIAKLAGDLQSILSGNDKASAQHQKLAQSVHAAFNGAHLSSTQKQSIENDVQKIFQGAGVPAEKATAVLDDLKAVENETK